MTLHQRIAKTLADFKLEAWRDDWDTTVVAQDIGRSKRGPGLVIRTTIADGFVFTTPVEPGDDLTELFGVCGAPVH